MAVGQQKADARLPAPPDAAPQLVELGQAKAFRVFDDHDRGVGDIHPHLHHRGSDQNIQFTSGKGLENLFFFFAHLSVDQAHPGFGQKAPLQRLHFLHRGLKLYVFGLLHQGKHHVSLFALFHSGKHIAVHIAAPVGMNQAGIHGLSVGWQLPDFRDIQISIHG